MPSGETVRGFIPVFLALVVVIAPLPFIIPDYMLNTLIMFFIWAIIAQSWNLVWGIAGVWSLGQMAIFAMAGYCTGWLILHAEFPPLLAALFGIAGAVAASLAMALPSIRLKGVYVILLTISFHEIFRILLTTNPAGFTGGIFGLPRYAGIVPEGIGYVARTQIYYYIGFALFMVATAAVWFVLHSRLGLAFKAIGQAPLYAASRGISLLRTQVLAFIVSGAIAGLAGAFWANYFGTIAPGVLSYDTMVLVFAMMVIGGWGTFFGPILGAFLLVWVSEFLHETHEFRLIILGSLIVVASVALPDGLSPQVARLVNWVRRSMGNKPSQVEDTT